MYSNPTPRAYLVDLYNNVNSVKRKNSSRNKSLSADIEGYNEKQNKDIHYHQQQLVRKIDSITKSCTKPYFNKILKDLAKENAENAFIICDYIISEETELNIKTSTKESRIKVLTWLSNFYNNSKSLRKMSKQDILEYLNNLRKPTVDDPAQRWVGSYNNRQIMLNKFFRWLYNPQESDQRKRQTPDCMKGIRQLPRKQKTPYSPTHLWDQREHAVF